MYNVNNVFLIQLNSSFSILRINELLFECLVTNMYLSTFSAIIFGSITNIYHKDETSEYSVFLFSMVYSKAVCSDGCLGVPLRVGLSATSPRYAVGFSLQSLTWVKYPKSLLSNIIITKYNAIIPFTSLKNTKSSAVGTLSYLSSVRYLPSYPE